MGRLADWFVQHIPGYQLADEALKNLVGPDHPLIQNSLGDITKAIESSARDTAQDINAGQLATFQQAMSDATPIGDLTDPSTWATQGEVTSEGVAGLAANMAGQFSPQLLTLFLTRGMTPLQTAGATATVGGSQAGAEAANQVEQLLAPPDTSSIK